MNKTKLSVILDSVLITFAIDILIFVLLNKIIKNANFSFFICIFIGVTVFYMIFKHFNNKFNLTKIGFTEQNNAKFYLNFLTYTNSNFDINFYSNLINATLKSENIYENINAYFYINLKTKLTDFDFKILNEFYTNFNNKPFIIINKSYTEEFIILLNNSPLKYILVDYLELYNLMKLKNIFPTTLQKSVKFKKLKSLKNNATNSFNKKNFFKFFLSGISLITLSIIFPFIKYYFIFGTLLLIFSIICLFNKNKTQNSRLDLFSLTKKTDT